MNTQFTTLWQHLVAGVPALSDPDYIFSVRPALLRELLFEAFQAGVVHHATVVRELQLMAGGDVPRGPDELRTTFEAIFGGDRN